MPSDSIRGQKGFTGHAATVTRNKKTAPKDGPFTIER